MRRIAVIACAAVLAVFVLWRPASAGITSLWADDATLVKQLTELMKVNDELDKISDGMAVTASAAHNTLELYLDTRAAIDTIQNYSPDAFWRDLKSDFYGHYPGFQYLEGGDKRLLAWSRSRGTSPATAYEMIGAVFGDLSGPLQDRAKEGKFETRALWLQRLEAAGAFTLAAAAENSTKDFDEDAKRLYSQAETVRNGEAATIINAKASAMLAVQNSHLIRLLARRLRFDGINAAIDYGERVAGANAIQKDLQSIGKHVDQATKPPQMMVFKPLW